MIGDGGGAADRLGGRSDVSAEGDRLITNWLSATERLRVAKVRATTAEVDVIDTESALARWLLPDDARTGEKIAVWNGDSLIQAEMTTALKADAKVTIRKRGRYLGGQRIG